MKQALFFLLIHSSIFSYNLCEFDPSHNIEINVEVTEQLESIQSDYQKIDVYKTKYCGNMLVLDNAIQLTEWDNAGYHEMLAHVPLFSHPCPERVLIIGGGDGGTLKEVLKHPQVQEVILCEIDELVIHVSQKYFPEFAPAFSDARAIIAVQDAAEYIKKYRDYFDIILVDASDPSGPGSVLYTKEFYSDLKQALKPNGIIAAQGESIFFHQDQIKQWLERNKSLFNYSSYFYGLVPTYPSGMIGFMYCSDVHSGAPIRSDDRLEKSLHYYTSQLHNASFYLPRFFTTN